MIFICSGRHGVVVGTPFSKNLERVREPYALRGRARGECGWAMICLISKQDGVSRVWGQHVET